MTTLRRLTVLAGLAVLLFAAAAEADRLLYVQHLAVFDATGRRIGSAWPTSRGVYEGSGRESMAVEFRFGSKPTILPITEDGFKPDFLLFTGRGCTGQTLINPADQGQAAVQLHQLTAVAGPRSTLYIQSGPVRDRTFRSYLSPYTGECIDQEARSGAFVSARPVVDLADHFIPPFSVRTRAGSAVPRGTP
jgi:hypothetical protein